MTEEEGFIAKCQRFCCSDPRLPGKGGPRGDNPACCPAVAISSQQPSRRGAQSVSPERGQESQAVDEPTSLRARPPNPHQGAAGLPFGGQRGSAPRPARTGPPGPPP